MLKINRKQITDVIRNWLSSQTPRVMGSAKAFIALASAWIGQWALDRGFEVDSAALEAFVVSVFVAVWVFFVPNKK